MISTIESNMLSFTEYLIEQKKIKEFDDLFNDTNQHLYHLNELFLFGQRGLVIAKRSLQTALGFLIDDQHQHVSLKFDGSISIVFGYVPKRFLYDTVQTKANSLTGKRKESYLEQIKKFSEFDSEDSSLIFVLGYKAALTNPTKWVWDKETITSSDYPDNVQDLLNILLNNQEMFTSEFQTKSFLIQCDVLFHDRNEQTLEYGQPTFKSSSVVTKPNLITYEIQDNANGYSCGLVPHTFYKVTDTVQEHVASHQLIDSMFKHVKSNDELVVLGTADVYVINYKFNQLIQSQESVSPKLIKAYQSQLQKLPLVNSLSYYYDTIAQHSALKDHFLKYFNHVIFKDGLHWNRSSEVYESESLNTPDDFTDFMIRRNMIFDKDYTPDKNTKKISEKMSLSAAYHEHVDEFSRMILTVFKVYLSISNIKQKIWLQYHSLLQAGKIKTFYHQLFQSKYIPISHEGLVITEENSHGIVYKTKLVPQHEFSRLNFTAGTQSKYQKPISAKENDQRVKSIETLHWASDRIMVVSVGRFNPPTIGHMLVFNKLNELRKTLKLHKEQVHLFSTETEGNTQNPLSFKDKDMIIKKIVQDLYKVNDSRITTRIKEHDSIHPHSVVEELSQQLIEKHKQNLKPLLIIYVAGSEYVRGAEEELSKRLQMFANNLGVYFMFVQSGERIDDDRDMIQHELLKTISATRLRRAIKENDYVYVLSSEKEPIQHMQDTFKKGTKTLFNYKDKVYYWSKSKQLYQCIEPQSLLATTINKDYNLQKEILDKTRIGLG